MSGVDLKSVRPGFADESAGSQAVFRTALQALSHPGRVLPMPRECELPRHGQPAAATLLLALLDAECSLWLSASLRGTDAADWLRFHTGCRLVEDASQAQFLWVGLGDALVPLASLLAGTDAYPDQSATCVVEVGSLDDAATAEAWRLSGPGIATEQPLAVQGLPGDFVAQWAANHARFPCGVDLFLAAGERLAGLPRTTRILASRA